MIYTNRKPIHSAFYNAIVMRQRNYNKGDADYSVTELLNSPRQVWLQRRHEEELEIDVSELLSSWEGHLIHDAIEMDTPRVIVDFDGVKVSGKADWITPDSITDFKTTSVWSIVHGSHLKKWIQQLNCYAYLYYPDKDVDLYVEFYCTDWQRSKALQDSDYPPKQGRIQIERWSKAEQLAFIRARLQEMESQRYIADELLRSCTAEEMWQREDTYAVMKGDQKRALRVFSTAEEAVDFAQFHKDRRQLYIQERPGERTRCTNYCAQRKFCNQYMDYVNAQS
jgi:hypothetical protein